MPNLAYTILLITIIISGFALASNVHVGLAQTPKTVNGIIFSDTTWTKANSPYNLTGPIAVNQDVTLTIEAGTTVNLNTYYIQVNGTFIAIGTNKDPIRIGGNGQIIFTSLSNAWNEQTGSGCIIENSIIDGSSVSSDVTIKIIDSTINQPISVNGSSLILNSNVGQVSGNATLISNSTTGNLKIEALISNNNIYGNINAPFSNITNNKIFGNVIGLTITSNNILGDVTVKSGTATNNIIEGGRAFYDVYGRVISDGFAIHSTGSSTISNNTISSVYNDTTNLGIYPESGNATIIDNKISGFGTGINRVGNVNDPIILRGNIIDHNGIGVLFWGRSSIIEENLIINNTRGIISGRDITIQNNTIAYNTLGMSLDSSAKVVFNNIQNNNQSIHLSLTPANVDATLNWWGTTDQQAINQTIFDNKNDFNLGIVTFVPFLTSPNPQAPNPNSAIPTPNPSSSPNSTPTPTPIIPEFPSAIILAIVLVAATLAISAYKKKTVDN